MAAIHDGRVTVHLGVKIAWWVSPYLWMMARLGRLFFAFRGPDDGQIDRFVERQSSFCTKHGVRCYCNGKRV